MMMNRLKITFPINDYGIAIRIQLAAFRTFAVYIASLLPTVLAFSELLSTSKSKIEFTKFPRAKPAILKFYNAHKIM